MREGLETSSSSVLDDLAQTPSLPVVEKDGEYMLQFYWLDAYEDAYSQPGTVFLFGKVWVPEQNTHVR